MCISSPKPQAPPPAPPPPSPFLPPVLGDTEEEVAKKKRKKLGPARLQIPLSDQPVGLGIPSFSNPTGVPQAGTGVRG